MTLTEAQNKIIQHLRLFGPATLPDLTGQFPPRALHLPSPWRGDHMRHILDGMVDGGVVVWTPDGYDAAGMTDDERREREAWYAGGGEEVEPEFVADPRPHIATCRLCGDPIGQCSERQCRLPERTWG